MIAGTGLAVFYGPIWGGLHGYGYPRSSFLFRPEARFSDLIDFYITFSGAGHPYLDAPVNPHRVYFPFAYLMGRAVSYLPTALLNPLQAVFMLLCLLRLARSAAGGEAPSGKSLFLLAGAVLVSYPFIFAFDRGNPEFVTVGLLALFAAFILQDKWRLAAVPLAIAIAMKGIPAIFLIILLRERRFLAMTICILLAVAVTVIATAFFSGGFDAAHWVEMWQRLIQNQQAFVRHYGFGIEGAIFGSSLFGLMKYVLLAIPSLDFTGDLQIVGWIYWSVVLLFAGMACMVVLSQQRPGASGNDLLLLTLLTILLPHFSGDYKLLALFIPLITHIFRRDITAESITMYAIILVPKSFFPLYGYNEVMISVLLNPLFLTALLFLTLRRAQEIDR
jgi:hypothetical protein